MNVKNGRQNARMTGGNAPEGEEAPGETEEF